MDLDKLDPRYRLAALEQQRHDVRDRVLELLDELDAVEILRSHVPTHRRWLLDRLEFALQRIDSLDEAIADVEYEAEHEMEEGDPPDAA